jgi:murein DD-endopeptidase MepM/ murein hydrolase activator NlpD
MEKLPAPTSTLDPAERDKSQPPNVPCLGAWRLKFFWTLVVGIWSFSAFAQPFHLPTTNHALFEKNGSDRFFVGTTGKSWESGCFGCVRSDGWQMHEGLDIKCLQRDKHGEPTDPVMATADGTVAYFSNHPEQSNYGRYIVVRHVIDGIEVYSLYAHLSAIRDGLKIGQAVHTDEPIAVMGRTSNTRERITKERAHVHFELNLLYNNNYSAWHKKQLVGERNDHGEWNGQNLVGMDPKLILEAESAQGAKFNLAQWIRTRPELFRVTVNKTDFPWLRRYHALVVERNLDKKTIAGYEIAFDYNGLPFQFIPHTAAEMKSGSKYQLLAVNAAEYAKNHCRKFIKQRGTKWELTNKGTSLLDLLLF